MDKWNSNSENEYTGMTAQRRNRRRSERADGQIDGQIGMRLDPVDSDETDRIEELTETAIPGVFSMRPEPAETIESEAPEEKEEPAETEESEETVKPDDSVEPVITMEPIRVDETETPDKPEEPEKAAESQKTEEVEAPVEPAVQAADSRVPPEARRMAAAPYGVPREGAKRPGTRPQVAPKRPPMPEQRRPAPRPRREAQMNPEASMDSTMRTAAAPGGRDPRDPRTAARRERPARVNVGYAPGRMSDSETRQVPAADSVRESIYGRDAKAYLEKRKQPFYMEEERKPAPNRTQSKPLRIAVALLVIAGLVLTGWMLMKGLGSKDNTVNKAAPQILGFVAPETQGLIAPQTLTFSVKTGKEVEELKLLADGDREPETEVIFGDNADIKVWTIKMPVPTGFEGTVMLYARRTGEEEWADTGYTAQVSVSSPIGMEAAGSNTQEADPEDDDYYDEDERLAAKAQADENGTEAEGALAETPRPAEQVTEPPRQKPREQETEAAALLTPPPTPTPTPEPEEVTPTPALEVKAAAEADPSLITQTTVYSSVTKKEKEYNRSAKELIHMPAADEYTKDGKKLGVLTFRGDNFRRNAAIGTLSATPLKLTVMWQTEAGSARGTNQTYYGYQWTDQPVIARWSTEVRTKSNITESKIEKSALKEVIIPGVDGVIRFLDLEDGKITRNSIKLGYPMKGSPTLHPGGYPFMTVGQFARKMKTKRGQIGLRQYNLYSQKELKLIDGLDGKYHRPLNDIGSFETSALIDRVSDTLIVAGTNGMVYLESLQTNFDYSLGVLQISPSIVAMNSRAKGQKSNALLAVESSLAAYDRYIYYADMGGILRCVDTNTLKPVWAVDTGDSVMAAVALDLTENRELNLYTANMLNNRKKGNGDVQIRRYDALSGREIWCTDVGVFKSKKDKEKDNIGAKASPVIGQNRLSDLVYYTVTGLSEEGAQKLKLKADTPAALIALEKSSGKVVWAYGLGSRSESSPIALYDKDGNGWIVQCEQSGVIHLVDGRTGSLVNSLQIEGEIEASPAAYNNVVVVGTTGKGKAFVYGIEVKLDKPEESTPTPAPEETEAPGEAEEAEEEYYEEEGYDEEAGYGDEGADNGGDEYEEYGEYEEYDVDAEGEGG